MPLYRAHSRATLVIGALPKASKFSPNGPTTNRAIRLYEVNPTADVILFFAFEYNIRAVSNNIGAVVEFLIARIGNHCGEEIKIQLPILHLQRLLLRWRRTTNREPFLLLCAYVIS